MGNQLQVIKMHRIHKLPAIFVRQRNAMSTETYRSSNDKNG